MPDISVAWDSFPDATYVDPADIGFFQRGTDGLNFPYSLLAHKRVDGRFYLGDVGILTATTASERHYVESLLLYSPTLSADYFDVTPFGIVHSPTLDTTGIGSTIVFRNTSGGASNSVGLRICDTNNSHTLKFAVGSDLTADRRLTFTTGDASRTLDISAGNVTITAAGNAITSAADAAAQRTAMGVGIGVNVQAYAANLTTWAGVAPGTGVATALAVNIGSAGAFVTFNGALGTPSSATLTNAAGLPIAGLVASTSAAIGVGSIELGHASDTTIARSGAGDITIEGNAVYRAGGTDVAVADGGTGDSGTAWSVTTPTPTAGAGAFTSVAGSVRVKKIGKTVFFNATVTITTNGTAASFIDIALPHSSVNSGVNQALAGREVAITGLMAGAAVLNNSTTLRIVKYDGTYLGGNGYVINVTGVYEAA